MNFANINDETVQQIDNYCKEKLLPYLRKSGWHERRQVEIGHLCQYPFYSYPPKVIKLYREFYGLEISHVETNWLKWNFSFSVKFQSSDIDFIEDYKEEDWYLDIFYSKLLGVNLYYLGDDEECSRICIDDNYNFYTVSSYGIELWGRRSFYQGLYNLIFRTDRDTNPYYFRYSLGDYIEFKDYPRNAEGKILWTDTRTLKDEVISKFPIKLNIPI